MASWTNNVVLYDAGRFQQFNSGDSLTLTGNFTATKIESTGDMVVGGNLFVTGNITSAGSRTVALGDSFIDLLASNTVTASAKAGGLTVNVRAASATLTAVNFVAGVAATSDAYITVSSNPVGTVAAGDIIQVSGTTDGENDGLYVVQAVSAVPARITVKGQLTSISAQVPFANNQFITATSAGNIVKANVSAFAASDGVIASGAGAIAQGTFAWNYGATESAFGNSWTSLAAATVTLQAAYDNGPTITLTNGNDLVVSVPVSGTAAISLGANKASDFTVTGNTLTLSSDVRIDLADGPVNFEKAGVIAVTTTGRSAGDVVYVNSSGNAAASINDDVTAGFPAREVDGVVVAAGYVATVQGTVVYTAFDAAPAAGDIAYLSNTSGQATATLPTTAGQRVFRIGRVTSGTAVGGLYPVKLQLQYIIDL
jgi:hypothetical protein